MLNTLIHSLEKDYKQHMPQEVSLPIHLLISPETETYVLKDKAQFISDLVSASKTFKKTFNIALSYSFGVYVPPKLRDFLSEIYDGFRQKVNETYDASERYRKNNEELNYYLKLMQERDKLHKKLDTYHSITEITFQLNQISEDNKLKNYKINVLLREETSIKEKKILGKAHIGRPYTIINYSDTKEKFSEILLHEISHNLGAKHAKHIIFPTIMFHDISSKYNSSTKWNRLAKKQIRQTLKSYYMKEYHPNGSISILVPDPS